MSILKVDTINEKTSGNGVYIPGHVVQVVQTTGTSAISTSSTSAVATGISVNITPSSTSSRIHLTFSGRTYINRAAREHYMGLLRGSTIIRGGYTLYSTTAAVAGVTTLTIIDSPSTTSQVTYSLSQYVTNSDTTAIINPNNTADGIYTLTAMEIAQ
jgi:hypothetical protein